MPDNVIEVVNQMGEDDGSLDGIVFQVLKNKTRKYQNTLSEEKSHTRKRCETKKIILFSESTSSFPLQPLLILCNELMQQQQQQQLIQKKCLDSFVS